MSIEVPPTGSAVCAVVTTFHPDEGLPARVARLVLQVGEVVIVDDSGTPAQGERLDHMFEAITGVTVVHHPQNRGVAAALNSGVAVATSRGYRWILTMDDDTVVHIEMVPCLLDAWRHHERPGLPPIAMIGTEHAEGPWDREIALDRTVACEEKRGIITSGTLMPVEVHQRLGGFREEFFIDSVDYDFCLRARKAGWRVLRMKQIAMRHRLGNTRRVRVGPWCLETTNHGPLRRYYAVRNSLVLAGEHLRRDPAYAVAVAWFHAKSVLLVVFLERARRQKFGAMLAGAVDAWHGRLGPRSLSPRGRVVART